MDPARVPRGRRTAAHRRDTRPDSRRGRSGDVRTFGVQGYLAPDDPAGPALLAGVVRSLSPAILEHGIATAEEMDLPTLQQRFTHAVREANAVILPPTVAGAWGRRTSP